MTEQGKLFSEAHEARIKKPVQEMQAWIDQSPFVFQERLLFLIHSGVHNYHHAFVGAWLSLPDEVRINCQLPTEMAVADFLGVSRQTIIKYLKHRYQLGPAETRTLRDMAEECRQYMLARMVGSVDDNLIKLATTPGATAPILTLFYKRARVMDERITLAGDALQPIRIIEVGEATLPDAADSTGDDSKER